MADPPSEDRFQRAPVAIGRYAGPRNTRRAVILALVALAAVCLIGLAMALGGGGGY